MTEIICAAIRLFILYLLKSSADFLRRIKFFVLKFQLKLLDFVDNLLGKYLEEIGCAEFFEDEKFSELEAAPRISNESTEQKLRKKTPPRKFSRARKINESKTNEKNRTEGSFFPELIRVNSSCIARKKVPKIFSDFYRKCGNTSFPLSEC